MGASYGEPLPDTGKSPTEEEFTVARRRGIPILAFCKGGVVRDSEQAQFVARVEDYRTGLFRAAFGSTPDLLVEVARGLREVSSTGAPLVWRPLASPVVVPWDVFGRSITYGTIVVVHVIPVSPTLLPDSALSDVANRLARCGRDSQLLGEDRALDLRVDEGSAVAVARSDGRAPFAALRESRSRALSVATQLPSDMMGPVLDQKDVADRFFRALGIASDRALTSGDIAVAIELNGLQILSHAGRHGPQLGRDPSGSRLGSTSRPDRAVEPVEFSAVRRPARPATPS